MKKTAHTHSYRRRHRLGILSIFMALCSFLMYRMDWFEMKIVHTCIRKQMRCSGHDRRSSSSTITRSNRVYAVCVYSSYSFSPFSFLFLSPFFCVCVVPCPCPLYVGIEHTDTMRSTFPSAMLQCAQ